MTAADAAPDGATRATVLNGRVSLWQPERGYRAGLDAALLAAACDADSGERVLDVGCGPGAAMLAAAARCPEAAFTGIEKDGAALSLARRNIDDNVLADRVAVMAGTVARPFRALALPRFDVAICNPPFFDDPAALRPPSDARRDAWMADDGLAGWLTFLLEAVRDGGRVLVVHRADRLGDILAGLSGRAGSFQIKPVHPFADAPAKRVLVRAVRGGRAPLVLLPALVLHPRGGAKHMPEAEAILRGEAALGWL